MNGGVGRELLWEFGLARLGPAGGARSALPLLEHHGIGTDGLERQRDALQTYECRHGWMDPIPMALVPMNALH